MKKPLTGGAALSLARRVAEADWYRPDQLSEAPLRLGVGGAARWFWGSTLSLMAVSYSSANPSGEPALRSGSLRARLGARGGHLPHGPAARLCSISIPPDSL